MGIPFKFHLESFWNLGGITMEIPLEFHWESMGIHGNPQEWHIPTIPADSQWNSNIPFWQNPLELMEEGKVLEKRKIPLHCIGDGVGELLEL